jgi:3-oxoacyl-[acyl-carrier-protein] synthase II
MVDLIASPSGPGQRVVVTGSGAISPLGLTVAQTWDAMLAGVSGAGPITSFDAVGGGFATHFACEVKGFDPAVRFAPKEARRMDRVTQFAAFAAFEAVAQSGLRITSANAERVGVIIGSGIGGLATLETQLAVLRERGPRRVNPFLIPMMTPDVPSGMVSILLGAKGTNFCTVSACATSAHAIGEATAILRRGDADAIVAGGTEAAITPLAIAGFNAATTLSTRNDAPQRASRPFDAQRDGFVLGEGAAILVLERYEHAVARGAQILGEILGYGSTADAYHITHPAPGGEGSVRAMALALADAELRPEQIDYLNAHGTSTQVNEQLETAAIKGAFGEYAYRLPISSTKSMTGHLLGAAGALEAIAALMALRDQMIPPTINQEYPDSACDLDYVPNTARPARLTIAMSNSLGFGGHNVSLILGRGGDGVQ